MTNSYLEADALQKFEVLSILAEIFEDFGMVHVVGVVGRDGEVTVAHHLLGDVDGQGAVYAGSVWLRHLLWTPFTCQSSTAGIWWPLNNK